MVAHNLNKQQTGSATSWQNRQKRCTNRIILSH